MIRFLFGKRTANDRRVCGLTVSARLNTRTARNAFIGFIDKKLNFEMPNFNLEKLPNLAKKSK